MAVFYQVSQKEQEQMLKQCGCASLSELFLDVPEKIRLPFTNQKEDGLSQMETEKRINKIAEKNRTFPIIFRGAGAYATYQPAIVSTVVQKESFLTAYTPYQAEMSQGLLQSIFEYQTMMSELTGLPVCNAGVYDGACAAAEAVLMCTDTRKNEVLVSSCVPGEVISVIQTYIYGRAISLKLIPETEYTTDLNALKHSITTRTAAVIVAQPSFYGTIEKMEEVSKLCHQAQTKLIAYVNPVSLALLACPGEYCADIAVGEAQPLGLGLSFGGPYLGFMTCTKELMRKLCGRIVGETKDAQGRTGYVLTLQAREQHIRREKAVSNICSNEALCALAVSVYLATMGEMGLKNSARLSYHNAHLLQKKLDEVGLKSASEKAFFQEFVTVSDKSREIEQILLQHGILPGLLLSDTELLWCCTDLNTEEEITKVVALVKEVLDGRD